MIRRATIADIPRLKEIRAAVRENILTDPSKVTDAHYHWFIHNAPFPVWEDHRGILGFAAADVRDGTVWAVFIDPDYEGQGIGCALLQDLCQSMKERGYDSLTLSTDAGTRADGFYQSAGWKRGDVRPNGEVTFAKNLQP